MISSRVLLRGTTVLLSRFPRRCLSTTTPDLEDGLEAFESIKNVKSTLRQETSLMDAALVKAFGTAEMWLQTYNRHKESSLLIAVSRRLALGADDESSQEEVADKRPDPITYARSIVAVSQVVSTLSADEASHVLPRLVLCDGLKADFGAAVSKLVNTPESAKVLESVFKATNLQPNVQVLMEYLEHLNKVPVLPVLEWPEPTSKQFVDSWNSQTSVYELSVDTWQIKQQAKYAEWAQVCSHMQINALLTGFYTTGNKVYLLRVLEKALQYSPYMDSLGVDYIMEITKPLPEEITKKNDLQSVVCQSSRTAFWHLVVNSRVHPEVTEVIAEEIAALSKYMVSDDARKAISKNAVDAATEAACKEKLRFYPKVLFLMSSLAFQE